MPRFVYSELSRRVTIDGITVDLQIYRLASEQEWILVVVNESGSSTVWNYLFASDTAALIAFVRVVEEEGMAAFLRDDETHTLH